MHYAKYGDILQPTWTMPVGTARTGYGVTKLGNLDPSDVCWIDGVEIRVTTDLGVATEVAAVAIINHTFQAGSLVRVQANASNVWTSPTLNEVIAIDTAYLNGFACHALLDLSALLSSGSRTFRYWSFTNIGAGSPANDRTVAIGEIVLATAWRLMDPSLRHEYQRPGDHLSASQRSKRGVQTVYDYGSRDRRLVGSTRVNAAERDTLQDWCDEQHVGARPMLVQLDEQTDSRRDREPLLCRFAGSSVTPVTIAHDIAYDVSLGFDELGCGELVGA